MSFTKRYSAASLAILLLLLSGRTAAAQSGGSALGYSNYAFDYASKGYDDLNTPPGSALGDLALDAYNFSYYAHYYTYYGYYVDRTYFGFAYGYAKASHDLWLMFYDYFVNNDPLRQADFYYAQYFASLTADYSYNAAFGN